jgi:hypothetical protein
MAEIRPDYSKCNLNVFLQDVLIEVMAVEDHTYCVIVREHETDDQIWYSRGWYDRIAALQAALSALQHGEVK